MSHWRNNTWRVIEDVKFISDPILFGWHIVEPNATNNALVRSYVWGRDLSGTIDGAGGVGGLLWVNQHVAPSAGAHFCAYDGNGNIVALSAASGGSETARYEYGLPQLREEPIRVTGPMAKENPFRFSTKRTCNITDLVLYEYRAYNPGLGRWLSRDPYGEPGFETVRRNEADLIGDSSNPYVLVQNRPTHYVDLGGLFEIPGTGIHLTGCYSYEVTYVSHTTVIVKKPFFAPEQKILNEVAKKVKEKFPIRGKGGECFGRCIVLIHIAGDFTCPPVTQTGKILLWDVTITVTVTIHINAEAKICCGVR